MIDLVAREVGVALATSGRPLTTVFLTQVGVVAAVRWRWVEFDPSFSILLSWPALGVGLALAVLETLVLFDDDAEEFIAEIYADRFLAFGATLVASLLLIAAGAPPPPGVAAEQLDQASSLATQAALVGDHPLAWKIGAVALALVANQALTWARARILQWLRDTGMAWLWRGLETGGLPIILLLLIFAPVLMLVGVVLISVVLAALAITARVMRSHADKRQRRPCPQCEHLIRKEASLCFQCKAPVEPLVRLGEQCSQVGAEALSA